MFEFYDNKLCVQANWLIEVTGILTKPNYDKLTRTAAINTVRRGGLGHSALVEYSSLPDRFRVAVEAKVGNPYLQTVLRGLLGESAADAEWLNGCELDSKTRSRLMREARYMQAMWRLDSMSRREKLELTGARRIEDIWEGWARLVVDDAGVKLPKAVKGLKRVYKAYKDARNSGVAGISTRVHKNRGNAHRAKITTKTQEAALMELRAHMNNFNFEQLTNLYNSLAEAEGWPKVTRQTVRNHFEGARHQIAYAGRRGRQAYETQIEVHMRRNRPSAPLYFVSVDGWDAELLYRKDVVKNGQLVTTYHNRLVVVVVLDPFNYYPWGYAIGERETAALIQAAFVNGMQHSYELTGQYMVPWQVQSDNFARSAMSDFYEKFVHMWTPARVRNAKAKPVESYFNQINTKYAQLYPNWSGHNITSSAKNQPNKELKSLVKRDFPDAQGVRVQIAGIMEAERKQKQAEWLEHMQQLAGDDVRTISRAYFLEQFGSQTGYTNKLTSEGICPTIEGVQMAYNLLDETFQTLRHIDWTVHYDTNDLSNVLVTGNEGQYRYMVQEAPTVHMALKDATAESHAARQEVEQFNAMRREAITEQRRESRETLDELLSNSEAEVAQKLQFIISGKQKDLLKDAKATAPEELAPEITISEVNKRKPRGSAEDIAIEQW